MNLYLYFLQALMAIPKDLVHSNHDFIDSGRCSPIVTTSMKESLRVACSSLDTAVVTSDENGVNETVTSAIMVLQQSFEERHLLNALDVLKITLRGGNGTECTRMYIFSLLVDDKSNERT